MKISTVTIGKLIEAHYEKDEVKFKAYAEYIADVLKEQEDERGERIIRSRINGTYKNNPKAIILDNGGSMKKVKLFEKELAYIKNSIFKADICYLIDGLPEYFFEIPASSTGKYHPEFASSKNGLVKHTKVSVRFAYELFSIENIDLYTLVYHTVLLYHL